MNFLITIRIAFRALAKNKMRAALTMLGVVIGVAAVTTLVSVGQSFSDLVQGALRGLGTNVLIVQRGSAQRGGITHAVTTLTADDAYAIERECPAVLAASPLVGAGGLQVVYGNSNWSPRDLFGVGPNYLTVRNLNLRAGGFFTERDVKSRSLVCVIGQTVVEKLFQTTNPLDQKIRIKNKPFRVIGVLEAKGANLFGMDQDDVVLIPYTTVQKRLQGSAISHVHAIMVSARSMDRMAEAEEQIRHLLRERHGIALGEAEDFKIQNTTEIARVLGQITFYITVFLAAVAGISLIVGGVGIMNIMLVSVTERTREIGIRMAMGARSRDILRQFLIESVLLSSLGGIVGILLGILGSTGLTSLFNMISSGSKTSVVISLPAAGVAMAFAAAVGIFFGYYPARRASRLDPIDALRYE